MKTDHQSKQKTYLEKHAARQLHDRPSIENIECKNTETKHAALQAQTENSTALGAGFRCGFLGLLHADVFHQRLQEEFGAEIIATAPTVPYRIKHANDEAYIDCTSPLAIPSGGFPSKGTEIEEPLVEATIICQPHVVGKVVELCMDRRGEQLEQNFLDDSRVILRYRLPLGEVAADFADELKSRSSGYATFDYDDAGMAKSDIVRMDVLVNGSVVDALATLVHRSKAQRHGRDLVARLKEALPRQLYEVALQAALGSKVIARETISAMRKNVTAKCYGGDISRKKKLLEKQKEGKRRMRRIGNVDIPNETFAGFSTQGFSNQKAFSFLRIKGGRVELNEFHIFNCHTCAVGHGNSVARGD